MKLEFASLTDVGQIRQKNEDATGRYQPEDDEQLAEKGAIFVVADGMGGHRGGEIASELAVEAVVSLYYASREKEPSKSLAECFSEANRRILEKSASEVDLTGMGTTCTTMVIRGGEAYFAHVGDSRAYVLRDGGLVQITDDHSLVGEMVRSGILSNEDAQNHPKRNVITRSLGTHEELAPDFPSTPYKLAKGDAFVLCSDGLTSMVTDEELGRIVGSHDPRRACRALVDLANAKGGKDNITLQIVKILQVD
jgi:protein phosphatase